MCLQIFIFQLPFSWNRKSRLCQDLSSVEPSKFKLLVLRLCRHELGEKVVQFMLINTNLTSYLWKTCSGMHTSIRIVFVICNNAASDRRINLFDRLQHARYEHSIVVASVYKRLQKYPHSPIHSSDASTLVIGNEPCPAFTLQMATSNTFNCGIDR